MGSLVNDVNSLPMTQNWTCGMANKPLSKSTPSFPPSKSSRYEYEWDSVPCCASVANYCAKRAGHPSCSVINQKYLCICKTVPDSIEYGGLTTTAKDYYRSHRCNCEHVDSDAKLEEIPSEEKVLMVETKSCIELAADNTESSKSSGSLDSEGLISGPCEVAEVQFNNRGVSHLAANIPSPSSIYSATLYVEAKQSFTNTEVSKDASTGQKSDESIEVSNLCDTESRITSTYRGSTGSNISDESSSSTRSSTTYKPHKANDRRWEAIQAVRSHAGLLEFRHFRLLMELGSGDIGSVYLSELIGTETYFAIKIMDKAALEARKKLLRAQTELEILQSLDHPFLPTLYTHFDMPKSSCLVMEFCPGGDLHALRQRQPGKCFTESAARFYVAEVLLALEYLHMLGIIYRDLKPENVLVRDDGHIMLSDFDLSLRCVVCPTLVKSSNWDSSSESKNSSYCIQPACILQLDCMRPACFGPSLLTGKQKKVRKMKQKKKKLNHQFRPLPELIAEPTSARSMSFVGTHEYLAPEIIRGEGHGSAVDWWTFGIFLYELLFGKTPFKGEGNRGTLFNVFGQPWTYPEPPTVSLAARDLIRGLLVKEPQHRVAYRRGATEIKQHPFFQNVNWALIRCTNPPQVPKQVAYRMQKTTITTNNAPPAADVKACDNNCEIEYF